MLQKNISVSKSARYYVLGEVDNPIEQIWFVCHGYGELARYFLRKFEILNDGKTLIVAPEALNRFYSKGFSGRVGASWMTKDDRESEIADYLNYLNCVYAEVLSDFKDRKVKTNALGFSQGTATIFRWAEENKSHIDKLVIWAGFFPHDFNMVKNKALINNLNPYIIIGEHDEFFTKELTEEHCNMLTENGVNFQLQFFNGGHEIHEETLLALAKKL